MAANSNDDCYFYYYSSCTKGNDCPFRHCELALGTETVCILWRQGLCFRKNCRFRHMESRINRATIPCYWETQPSGCRKPHCVFLHQQARKNISNTVESQKLILPVATSTPVPGSPPVPVDPVPDTINTLLSSEPSESLALSSPTQPIEPFVVSFDEAEESDTESTTSTPIKVPVNDKTSASSIKNSASTDSIDVDRDLGIKTLEQLRMEKIHRESEHFYKSAFDAPALENVPKKIKVESAFPQEAFLHPDEPVPVVDTTSCDDNLVSRDLRDFIQRKRSVQQNQADTVEHSVTVTVQKESNNKEAKKRIISLKRAVNKVEDESAVTSKIVKKDNKDALGFKIKTLEEIRKEKENKLDKYDKSDDDKSLNSMEAEIESLNNKRVAPDTSESMDASDIIIKHQPKRIKRQSIELYQVHRIIDNNKTKENIPDPPRRTLRLKKCKADSAQKENVLNNNTGNTQSTNDSIEPSHSSKVEALRPFIRRNLSSKVNSSKTDSSANMENDTQNSSITVDNSVNIINSSTVTDRKDMHHNGFDPDYVTDTSEEKISFKSNECTENTKIITKSFPIESTHRTPSVDDFENLFLNEDADLTLDDADAECDKKAEDLFLEIEQMLKD